MTSSHQYQNEAISIYEVRRANLLRRKKIKRQTDAAPAFGTASLLSSKEN